jgi:hypothetical protein
LVEERIDARLARVYQAADEALSRGGEPLEAARRFVAMLQQEREAYLLLIDFWNQAVRDPTAPPSSPSATPDCEPSSAASSRASPGTRALSSWSPETRSRPR